MQRYRIRILVVLSLLGWGPAMAGMITKECRTMIYDRYYDPNDRANWQHMHHFCACRTAYFALLRAKSAQERRFQMTNMEGECGYVFAHTRADFKMRPLVHLQLARGYKAYRSYRKALKEYRKALQGNPRLTYAYAGISDIYRHQHNYKGALQVINEGLRHVPRSKALRRRKKRLEKRLAKASAGD